MIEIEADMNTLRQRVQIQAVNHEPPPIDSEPKTISWLEIEDWQKDNEYILHGYRRPQYSWWGCLKSVFGYIHNETANIHSHLWGGLIFAYYLFATIARGIHPDATWIDTTAISIFLSSAIFCLFGSAAFHTSMCHSEPVATQCNALDYTGIAVLIVGSAFPSIYYGFYCHRHLQAFYLVAVAIAGIGACTVVLNPEYSKPTHRVARTMVFIGLGLCGLAPVGHIALITRGLHELLTQLGFEWVFISGALYIIGATIYANRIPEKLYPGTFDFFLASHQIFHVCVVLAALAYYRSILTALDYRMTQSTC